MHHSCTRILTSACSLSGVGKDPVKPVDNGKIMQSWPSRYAAAVVSPDTAHGPSTDGGIVNVFVHVINVHVISLWQATMVATNNTHCTRCLPLGAGDAWFVQNPSLQKAWQACTTRMVLYLASSLKSNQVRLGNAIAYGTYDGACCGERQ